MPNPHQMGDAEFIRYLAKKIEDRAQAEGRRWDSDALRLHEIIGHLPEGGNLDPWAEDRMNGVSNSWGPGPIEEFAKLTDQSVEPVDPIEAINIFIRRNVPRSMHGHLLDDDENDGTSLRTIVGRALGLPEWMPEVDES